ncbi:hypothetical protein EDB81DRAFT_729501 [Dactylonectria macrodidyma]|uniref:FAD-binding PCMH-type domain-containing protein n=1 Tax=Dactylonectria macrodidyma TaxID=307937 RepID=A0A9P9IM31_9HYPO|nr:hypothetical protein EDB81DRAFT_729501 [Dactylonectria macrodidyma]
MRIRSQVILSAACASPFTTAGCLPAKVCKAYPGTSDWPSQAQWNHLNKTLGGRLLHPTPPAAVCHRNWPNYDAQACSEVKSDWSVYEYHTENPISVMWDQFTNDTCLPDGDFPCSADGYPAYVVNVTTPEHVKLGIDFARKHSVRVVVKNTGHDYIGRSIAPGSLSLWTHHLKDIEYHEGSFKLDGCDTKIPGNAVTVGAGAQMYDIYTATDEHNQTIVGGGGKSVGIGGYVTGGGHSVLAPRYGLAADQVLQMELVTPSGKILTVNENQHSDLFWAMRGGGGSTFGVLTSITLQTHPSPKLLSLALMLVVDPDAPFLYDFIAYTLSLFPSLGDAGLSGYSFITSRFPNPIPYPGAPAEVAGVLGVFILQDTQDTQVLNNMLAPINQTIQARWPDGVQVIAGITPYNSFLGWFDDYYDQGTAGNSSYLVSRLLDKHALESNETALSAALEKAMGTVGSLSTFIVSGKGVHDAVPRGGSDAVNPGWRKSYVHTIVGQGFPPFNETARIETIDSLNNAFEPLRELSPDTGAYINEALPFEADWQHTFWGDNYERLLDIKRSVDPYDVLWCAPCVGNERWSERHDGRLCKID